MEDGASTTHAAFTADLFFTIPMERVDHRLASGGLATLRNSYTVILQNWCLN